MDLRRVMPPGVEAALAHVDGAGLGRGLRHGRLLHAPAWAELSVPRLPHLRVAGQGLACSAVGVGDRLYVEGNKALGAIMANLEDAETHARDTERGGGGGSGGRVQIPWRLQHTMMLVCASKP